MAKGKIKSVSNSQSSTGVNTTVVATGATGSSTQGMTNPPGQVLTGTLIDNQSGNTIPFMQSFGAEMGITVDSKVNYQTATVGGQLVANVLTLTHRGEIATMNTTDDGGTLLDRATGQTISFAQVGASESGLAKGAKVNFERIIDPTSGQFVAVALTVVND
jgi:hypothetical protein